MTVDVEITNVSFVKKSYVRLNCRILKKHVGVAVAKSAHRVGITCKLTVGIQLLERIVGCTVSSKSLIQISVGISCRCNLKSTYFKYRTVISNNAKRSGNTLAKRNVDIFCGYLVLYSESRTVYCKISVPTLLVNNGNIIKNSVLCLIDIRTLCDSVTVKNDILNSYVVTVNVYEMLTVTCTPLNTACKESVTVTVESYVSACCVE